MSLNDPLSAALSKIMNYERVGKAECELRPVSNTIKSVLNIMRDHKYVGSYTEIEDGRGNHIKINLLGRINNCGTVKPRFSVKKDGFEKFEKRYLPALDFGILIIATNKGVITHKEAKAKKIGGRLLAFCY